MEKPRSQREDPDTGSEQPDVSGSFSQHDTVTLLNGAEVGPGQVIATLGELDYLVSLGAKGHALLWDLYGLSKGDPPASVGKDRLRLLQGHGLVGSEGTPSGPVRDIILSALVERRGKDGLPELSLQTPYPESDKNDAVLLHFTRAFVKRLGLESVFRKRPSSPGARGRSH